MREEEMALASRRLDELASRAGRTDRPCFSGFLSPPELEAAQARYQQFEKDLVVARQVEGLIAAIGTVTADSLAALQRAQTAFAFSIWSTAGPVFPTGTNSSGSTVRQAALSRQSIGVLLDAG